MVDPDLFLDYLDYADYVLENWLILANYQESKKPLGKDGNIVDKVGDLLIRIKNGYMASKKEVISSYSKLNLAILEVLVKGGFIAGFRQDGNQIKIKLKYEGIVPALTDVKRLSKPGRRVYMGYHELPIVLNGLGICLISTPKGVMNDKTARKEKLGGEVMALVW